ncbi:potassium-transporting ATPase subunit KdpA [Marinobacterium stanieri]|uniref:potassium-transporting ATPase subunit KdpA n=1 Tax=Marinobacterium stanieri TaxID=49186 RepID=UPI003A9444FD
MNEVILIYAATLLLAWPLGKYIASVFSGNGGAVGAVFLPIERCLYRLCGVDPSQSMSWQDYGKALLKLHLLLVLIVFGLLMAQGFLFMNPDGIGGMSWDLALHTAISFLTNTNQQHYSGQAQLSYLAHTFGIVTLQVVTPAAGMAALVAIVRTLFGHGVKTQKRSEDGPVSVGNFYEDITRAVIRVMLPVSTVVALIIASQGVPNSYEGARTATPLDQTSGMEEQHIPIGPVAPMVAIKQVGTNGGGWYGPNSSVPLENPTPVSNAVQTMSLVLIPAALVFALGFMTSRRRLARMVMGVMVMMSVSLTLVAIWSENQPNVAFSGLAAEGPNLEGKEVRFGATATALWGSWSTQTSNGSVNGMHDSFNPIGGMIPLIDMFINVTFGGIGVGLIGFLLFMLLAAFLGSLMIGRAPEIAGKALEAREMKLVCIALLIQPLLILGLGAIAVTFPALTGNSNTGFHGLSQVIYEYTSAFANNGSGFEGLNDDTVWWNLTCAVNLALGRFIPILALLAISASLAAKRSAPEGRGSLSIDTPTFGMMTVAVIVMFTLLSFMPVLILGPIAETLALMP